MIACMSTVSVRMQRKLETRQGAYAAVSENRNFKKTYRLALKTDVPL